jgi:diguanylate cyclase (GGDEF)-like protein
MRNGEVVQLDRYGSLAALASLVADGGVPSETLHHVARSAAEGLDAAWCDIYDYDPATDEFVVAAFHHIPELLIDVSDWLGARYDAENWPELSDCVAERRAAVLYRDDPDLPAEQAALMDEFGELANVSVPLVYGGEVVGLVDVGECRTSRRWSDDDLGFAQALADLSAVAVALARTEAALAEQAIRDELTGLFNIRHFMDRLRREVTVSRRYGHDLSLLLIDLDGFRLFNQTFGGRRGDAALVEVAAILLDATRTDVDIVARYAMDQFLVLLPQARANDPEPRTADGVAQRIRERIDAHRFESEAGQRDVAMTASIGLAGIGLGGYSAEELLSSAQKAAYLAKHDGKDRVVTFGA